MNSTIAICCSLYLNNKRKRKKNRITIIYKITTKILLFKNSIFSIMFCPQLKPFKKNGLKMKRKKSLVRDKIIKLKLFSSNH